MFRYITAKDFNWNLVDGNFKFAHPCPNFNLLTIKNDKQQMVSV